MPKCIDIDDWHFLRRSLQAASDAGEREMETRAATELMYYGGLTATEVSNIRIDGIRKEGAITWLHIPSRARGLKNIYLLPPVIQTIDRLLGYVAPGMANLYSEYPRNLESPCEPFLISRRSIAPLVCRAFRSASERALSEDNHVVAARLMAYTPHSLRHAFEIHACGCNAENFLWQLIGAERLVPQSTRQYLTRPSLTEEGYLHACEALSRFWQMDSL